jgi:hypothetical protein
MSIYTPGCGELPSFTCQDCPVKEDGRVRAIWVQKVSYTFSDITDPNEWDVAICSGDVVVFPYTNGTADQAEQLSDGYGNVPQDVDSYEYTLNIHEPQYKNNVAFWNFMRKSNQHLVGYKTQTLCHLSTVAAKFIPKAPVSADLKIKIDLNIIIKFVQRDLIVPTTAPTGIFDQCIDC